MLAAPIFHGAYIIGSRVRRGLWLRSERLVSLSDHGIFWGSTRFVNVGHVTTCGNLTLIDVLCCFANLRNGVYNWCKGSTMPCAKHLDTNAGCWLLWSNHTLKEPVFTSVCNLSSSSRCYNCTITSFSIFWRPPVS